VYERNVQKQQAPLSQRSRATEILSTAA